MQIGISVNVTDVLGNRKQEIQEAAEKQVSELKKIKGGKLTSHEELQARHVDLKNVSWETIELAKKVTCNILLSAKEARHNKKTTHTKYGTTFKEILEDYEIMQPKEWELEEYEEIMYLRRDRDYIYGTKKVPFKTIRKILREAEKQGKKH